MFKGLFSKKVKKIEEVVEVKTGLYTGSFLINGKMVYGCYLRNTANKEDRVFLTEEGVCHLDRSLNFVQKTREVMTNELKETYENYEASNVVRFLSFNDL